MKGRGKFKEIKDHYCCLFFLIEQLKQKAQVTTFTDSFMKTFFFLQPSDQLLCQINPSGIYCPLLRERSPTIKLYLQTTYLTLFFKLMGLVISSAAQGVNQILLVVTVLYAIFFSKGAINFNDRQYSGLITIGILYVSKD